ncbi:pilus assembly PilX family protein [Halomonas cerina]|uniref:Type 4 fimbrial biogenesis protein PilX N-terminal domain-containing protein n=1 Tax=Halomonas cerina TaxID=447424 RepID=A0A839VG79_9GAMM|nr:PilX N-terminal domain-containing pilus assembly protein [Halomonas cerina]MBB3191667.1 hypothetical protein [Halomonas cerina]
MFNKQGGAALIVVLSLLTVSLMLGVSGMQSALIEERLAGNYKAMAEAQMGAEMAASEGWEKLGSGVMNFSSASKSSIEAMNWSDFVDDGNFEFAKSGDACGGGVTCYYRYIEDGFDQYIVAMGATENGSGAQSDPVFVEFNLSGFGDPSATVFPGGIAENAEVQWPNSQQSRMAGGVIEVDGVSNKVYAVSLYEAEGGLSAQDIMDGITGNNKTGLSLEEGSETLAGNGYPYLGLVEIIKGMYKQYLDEGVNASSKYPGVHFYEYGLDVTGNSNLEGLHVVLNGQARIGGNADLSGMLVVMNVDFSGDDWTPMMATRAKFNGGGNKGTVWFDETAVEQAISPFGVTVQELLGLDEGDGGGSASFKEILEWN